MTADLTPVCPKCRVGARLTLGAEIYPHLPRLARRYYYRCDTCDAYVGCHPGTQKPLGTPADKATRTARSRLHDDMLDPLWRGGGCARSTVYRYLAHHLSIDPKDCHTGMFDIERCRAAWRVLRGKTPEDIQAWQAEQTTKVA